MTTDNSIVANKQRILTAAIKQFITKGYEDTRLDDIVREAHVSKTAIYTFFGGKQELFTALSSFLCAEVVGSVKFPQVPQEHTVEITYKSLTQFGHSYINNILKDEIIGLFRLNIAIVYRFEDVAHDFYKNGPQKLQNALVDYLEKVAAAKTLNIKDPQLAAGQFMSLIRSDVHFNAIFDKNYKICPEVIEQTIDGAVDLFMNGYRFHH